MSYFRRNGTFESIPRKLGKAAGWGLVRYFPRPALCKVDGSKTEAESSERWRNFGLETFT